jgi:branched-chain amino acid transport system substrate-binding protein
MRNQLKLVLAGSAWALAAGVAGLPQPALADILVGVAGPMTGPFAIFGEEMKAGAEQAIAEINAAGGVLGEPLVLEVADDQCDPQKGLAVANQMAGRGIALMAGHFCSFASIPASTVYNDAKIVAISPASPNPRYTDERPGPGIFRIGGREDRQGKIAGAFLAKEFAGRKVAFIDDTSAYGKGLADATRTAMNEAGLKEILSETYIAGTKDYTPLVSKLRAANIDAVFIGGYSTDAAEIVRAMRDQGLATRIVAGDAILTEEYWRVAGDAAQGTLVTFAPDPRKDPANDALLKRFREKGIEPEGYVLPTYAAIQLWAQAAATAGAKDFDKVVEALGKGTFRTAIGEVTFDAKGDATLPAYVFYEWRNGRYDYARM